MLSSLTIRLSVAAILQQPSNVKAYVCVCVMNVLGSISMPGMEGQLSTPDPR